MSGPEPIYTTNNCKAAYQLNWSLSVFWREPPPEPAEWIEGLKGATEPDGVRILEHRIKGPRTSQFLLSTTPAISPREIIRSVKARLQVMLRASVPKAFHRNYSIYSVGSAKREAIENYLESQLEHHPMADPRVQARLEQYQIDCPEADLSRPRRTSHGEFIHNLHLVLVNDGRWRDVEHERLRRIRDMIVGTARKKGHLPAKARILADHIHLTLGCGIEDAPVEVATGYLNNLAYAQEMRPVYQFGFFVGTFGNYDLGAIRQALE